MRLDLRRAAERIAARQQPPAPSAVELQMGLDQHRSPRWQPDGEAWLEYCEDGPHEVFKVLKTALEERGEYDALMGGNTLPPGGRPANPSPPALWRSPDDRSDLGATDANASAAAGDASAAAVEVAAASGALPIVAVAGLPPTPSAMPHHEEEEEEIL